MIDIVGDNSSSRCNFVTYKFRCNFLFGYACPKTVTSMLLTHSCSRRFQLRYTLVFANSDIFHFGGNDPFSGIMQLRYLAPFLSTLRFMALFETYLVQALVDQSCSSLFGTDTVQHLHISPIQSP